VKKADCIGILHVTKNKLKTAPQNVVWQKQNAL
jgi:hypothetical protein